MEGEPLPTRAALFAEGQHGKQVFMINPFIKQSPAARDLTKWKGLLKWFLFQGWWKSPLFRCEQRRKSTSVFLPWTCLWELHLQAAHAGRLWMISPTVFSCALIGRRCFCPFSSRDFMCRYPRWPGMNASLFQWLWSKWQEPGCWVNSGKFRHIYCFVRLIALLLGELTLPLIVCLEGNVNHYIHF